MRIKRRRRRWRRRRRVEGILVDEKGLDKEFMVVEDEKELEKSRNYAFR